MSQQHADALALIAETALHHGMDPGTPGERYQIVVHVDAAILADPDAPGQSVLEDGTHVPAENVSAPGVRCEPSGDASRRRWPCHRGRRPHSNDPAGATPGAPTSRSRLSLPRVRRPLRSGPSHPSLGTPRPDNPVEARPPLSSAPPSGSRRGLRRGTTARRRALFPAAGRPDPARKPAAGGGAGRSRRGATSTARGAAASH
jgi:hypothetical protein